MNQNMIPDMNPDMNIYRVFKMNWDSQVLTKLFIHIYNSKNQNKNDNTINNLKKNILNLIKKLILDYIIIFNEIENKLDSLETNYLVVIFEGINNIIKMCGLLDKNKKNIVKLKSITLKLFFLLMKNRWSNGFLYFTDGSARLDITGHLLNAF